MLLALTRYMNPGEITQALTTTNSLRPLLSHLVITSERIMAFSSSNLAGMKIEVRRTDILGVEVRATFAHPNVLVVTLHDRHEVELGDVQQADAIMLLQLIRQHAPGSSQMQAPPTGWRFNAPPGWPAVPPGWTPPPGWLADPSWPAAPPGWDFWSQAPQMPSPQSPGADAEHASEAFQPEAVAQTTKHHGHFSSKKRAELEEENTQLREWIQQMQGMDAMQLATKTEQLRTELTELQQQATNQNTELARVRGEIVQTADVALLQEVGIYNYHHPLADAVAYKGRLEQLKDKYKGMARGNTAVEASTTWQVNGSAVEGRRMVRDFSKLMLRAFNAEADNLVRSMRPYKLQASTDRLEKTAQTIARLGKTMSIRISPAYHQARVTELELTSDYLAKTEEEKDRIRAERERQREEQQAQREYEREKERLRKERSHYVSALARLEANADEAGITELEGKVRDVDQAILDVEGRKANSRAGYVYVISNIGAFGEHMVKIGMTRRLEPMDRVRELGDASVPFRFDVHAMIFSQDAVGLETQLHNALADSRVNLVNLRREFFYVTPAEIRAVVEDIAGQHVLEFHETPEALEWRTSRNQRTPESTAP
jgi:Domain of unknown function (DUF4041)/Meiotically up-regulated gene 113